MEHDAVWSKTVSSKSNSHKNFSFPILRDYMYETVRNYTQYQAFLSIIEHTITFTMLQPDK